MVTRSTRRAQISVAPCLESTKQSSQACKQPSLANCSSCHCIIFEISRKSIYSLMLLTNTDPENPVSKWFKQNITKIFQIVLVSYPTHSQNFIKILSSIFCNDGNRHNSAPSLRSTKMSSQRWTSPADCLVCHIRHILKISWKSVHPDYLLFQIISCVIAEQLSKIHHA